MNQKVLYAIIAVLAIILVIVLLQRVPTPKENVLTPVVGVNLRALNNSGQAGVAILREVEGKVEINLSIANSKEGVAQPAHIHGGSCPAPAAIQFTLDTLIDGMSETKLDVSLARLKLGAPLAIAVHRSTADGTFVSCGNIKL